MRILDFSVEDGSEFYEILYDGIVNSEVGLKAPSETRVIGRVLDKFEAAGVPDIRGGVATFSLMAGGLVTLEDAEYELATKALSHVNWLAKVARRVNVALDWMTAAPSARTADDLTA